MNAERETEIRDPALTTDSPSKARDRAFDTMARAIFEATHWDWKIGGEPVTWDQVTDRIRDDCRKKAAAALDALLACEGTGKRPALIEELAGERWEQVGEWCPTHGIVNLGEPWNWDYNDDHADYRQAAQPVYVERRIDQSTREPGDQQ